MTELGELESQHQEFEKRKVRVVVVSLEDQATAKLTQADFPHLKVVADADKNVAEALQVIQGKSSSSETTAPTTFLVDGTGKVRWVFRPDTFFTRLSANEVLAAVDQHMAK